MAHKYKNASLRVLKNVPLIGILQLYVRIIYKNVKNIVYYVSFNKSDDKNFFSNIA